MRNKLYLSALLASTLVLASGALKSSSANDLSRLKSKTGSYHPGQTAVLLEGKSSPKKAAIDYKKERAPASEKNPVFETQSNQIQILEKQN